jgi:3,4-dihydroxy 2-butanone 4-phosphate synthase
MVTTNVDGAIRDLQAGKFVLIYDADGREEETDLVIASEFVTPGSIKTMRKDAGGLICTTVAPEISDKLGLPFLTSVYQHVENKYHVLRLLAPNDIPYDEKSAFSLTINHRTTFTGITDKDRARTISEFAKLIRSISSMNDVEAQREFGLRFRSPGHVHLLRAASGLLNGRRGHTELATALTIMAGLTPTATICEMLADTCRAATRKEVRLYALRNNLKVLEGADIIRRWTEWSR